MHSFSWCRSASSFYFKMCLEHMNQIKLASICTEVGRFYCLYRPQIFCLLISTSAGRLKKRRWNRKKLHHDLILCNHFESYQRICLIFMDTHLSPVLWCFCNRIINNIWAEQFFRFRCNRDLFMAASTWQVDWLLLWIICAHDLIYVWTISLALIFKHLAGWVNLVWM